MLWASFEGSVDPFSECQQKPYLLIAYSSGFQVWDFQNPNALPEVCSYRGDKPVICGHVITAPSFHVTSPTDQFEQLRPLLAVYEAGSSRVDVISLRTLERLDGDTRLLEISSAFRDQGVQRIESNCAHVAVVSKLSILLFNNGTLQSPVSLTGCSVTRNLAYNPIALGERWLAFASNTEPSLKDQKRSGFKGDDGSSLQLDRVVDGVVDGAATLMEYGRLGMNALTGTPNPPPIVNPDEKLGFVKIVDTINPTQTLAHFRAFNNSPITYLAFNVNGLLLFVADVKGQKLHVFNLATAAYSPDVSGKSSDAVKKSQPVSDKRIVAQHIYTLERGATPASVRHASFSVDSRWLAVTSHRNTTHIYPLNALSGGEITPRSLCSPVVLNPQSAFSTTAGLGDSHKTTHDRPIAVQSIAKIKYPGLQNALPSVDGSKPSASTETPQSAMVTCFGLHPVNMLESTAAKSYNAPPHCLFVFVPDGKVYEHSIVPQFIPAPTNTQGAKPSLIATSAGYMSSFGAIVSGAVLGPKQETKGKATQMPFDNMEGSVELQTSSVRVWDVCRFTHWKAEKRLATRSRILEETRQDIIQRHRHANGLGPASWGADAMVSTYVAPTRRTWMGPQFTFKKYSKEHSAVIAQAIPILKETRFSNSTQKQENPPSLGSSPKLPIFLNTNTDITNQLLAAMDDTWDSVTKPPSNSAGTSPSKTSAKATNASFRHSPTVTASEALLSDRTAPISVTQPAIGKSSPITVQSASDATMTPKQTPFSPPSSSKHSIDQLLDEASQPLNLVLTPTISKSPSGNGLAALNAGAQSRKSDPSISSTEWPLPASTKQSPLGNMQIVSSANSASSAAATPNKSIPAFPSQKRTEAPSFAAAAAMSPSKPSQVPATPAAQPGSAASPTTQTKQGDRRRWQDSSRVTHITNTRATGTFQLGGSPSSSSSEGLHRQHVPSLTPPSEGLAVVLGDGM